MDRTCEVCKEGNSKYCCPACQIKTCSLTCVQNHKKESKCPGLRVAPPAPTPTGAKYDEEAFVQDYRFLEKVNTFADAKPVAKVNKRDKRIILARKFQQIAKLAEFHFLPETFSRAKQNQSKISRITGGLKQESEGPESGSSRSQQMIWSVDLLAKDSSVPVKTVHNLLDSESLLTVLSELSVKRLFLKLESRNERLEQSLLEITQEKWSDPLHSVLQGTRLIEYPIFVYE